MMDWYRTPSDFCRIAAWLEEACAGAGTLICSLDQLAYGGLLASRCMEVPEPQALRRAAFLRLSLIHISSVTPLREWMWYRPNARIPLPSSAMAHSFGRMRERKITTPYLHFSPKNSIVLVIIPETAPQGKAAQVSPLLFSNSALKGALMQEDSGFCRRVWRLAHAKSPAKTARHL